MAKYLFQKHFHFRPLTEEKKFLVLSFSIVGCENEIFTEYKLKFHILPEGIQPQSLCLLNVFSNP